MRGADANTTEKLLRQYHECLESWRSFQTRVWQIPVITILMISAIIATAYVSALEGLPRVLLLFMGAAVSAALWFATARYSYLMDSEVGTIKRIRDLERGNALNLHFVHGDFEAQYGDKRPKWRFWVRFRASELLKWSMCFVFGLMLALAIHESLKL